MDLITSAVISLKNGTTSDSNHGFFFCQILFLGDGCTIGKNEGK